MFNASGKKTTITAVEDQEDVGTQTHNVPEMAVATNGGCQCGHNVEETRETSASAEKTSKEGKRFRCEGAAKAGNVNVVAVNAPPAQSQNSDWTKVPNRRDGRLAKKKKGKGQAAAAKAPAGDVSGCKRRQVRAKRRIRAETIVVSCSEAPGKSAASYAEVLRSIHVLGKDLHADVKKVRRNRRGDLIFHLGKSSKGADVLQEAIIKAAGAGMVVSRQAPTKQVRDLDEGITREEVQVTLQRVLNEPSGARISVLDLRPAHDGTQVCTVSVPDNVKSSALLKDGRVKIGLVRCRLRERVAVTQCFRCLGFGHRAVDCCGADRSKMC